MTPNEQRNLYHTLLEVKEMQGKIMALLDERADNTKSNLNRLIALEDKVEQLSKHITTINAGLKAWFAACAAVGGFIGWLMHHFIFNSMTGAGK